MTAGLHCGWLMTATVSPGHWCVRWLLRRLCVAAAPPRLMRAFFEALRDHTIDHVRGVPPVCSLYPVPGLACWALVYRQLMLASSVMLSHHVHLSL